MKDIKQCLGKRIRELRKRQGYTQESLAEKIGIEPRNLLKIENAQTFPRVQTLEKLMEVLNCTPDELFAFGHLSDIEFMRQRVFEQLKTDNELVKLVYKMIS